MAGSLAALPNELLGHIFEFLLDEPSALCCLIRCSSFFRQLAQPYLYRNIKLDVCYSPGVIHIPHLLPLFVVLMQNESLATYVRSLSVIFKHFSGGGVFRKDRLDRDGENFKDAELLAIAHDRGFECNPAWLRKVQKCRDNVQTIGVLLPFLPSLEWLRLDFGHSPMEYLTPGLMLGLSLGPSTLTYLSLKYIYVRPSELEPILALSQVIRTLELQWSSAKHIWRDENSTPLADLDSILSSTSTSLEAVTLTYAVPDGFSARAISQEQLQVLRLSPRLKFVKMTTAFIFRILPSGIWPLQVERCLVDMLPRSLETLHIIRHTKESFDMLLTNIEGLLLAAADGVFSALRSVTVERLWLNDGTEKYSETMEAYGSAFQPILKELTKLGEGLGIRMRWTSRWTSRWEIGSIGHSRD